MPVTYPDTRVLPVAQKLLACLADAVILNPKPPRTIGFRTGTEGQPLAASVTADECCLGAAFLRVVRTFPSWSEQNPSDLAVRCAQPMAVEFEISMWRCAAVGSLTTLPPQAAWDELHTDLLNDRASMMAAVCCFIGVRDPGSVKYGDWQVVSAEGGCAGATMTILADLYGRST